MFQSTLLTTFDKEPKIVLTTLDLGISLYETGTSLLNHFVEWLSMAWPKRRKKEKGQRQQVSVQDGK